MTTVHEIVGGDEFFTELVERFYAGGAEDPILRPLYPDDLIEPKRHLAGFLIQYWGGSGAYSEERGHPRHRMRHAPFVIGPAERDIPPEEEQRMREYFSMSAEAMRNT